MQGRYWFGSVAAVVSMALVSTAAPANAVSVSPPASKPKAQTEKVTERPDRVSSMVAARVQGSRVEDLSARTPTSSTFANSDGTWSVEAYSGVVRSRTDDDEWVSVDAGVEKSRGTFVPKAVPFEAAYSDGGDKLVGTVKTQAGSRIQVGWPSKLPVPEVDGGTLTYPGAAADGSDLVVNSSSDGFDYSVSVDHAPAADAPQVEYRIPFSFDGLEPTIKQDGSVVFREGKHVVATMTAPVMWDSAPAKKLTEKGDPRVEEHPNARSVDMTIEGTGDTRTLVLRPNMDYLRDPERVFPVVVDPQVNMAVAGDTWAASEIFPADHSAAGDLAVGSVSLGILVYRSFLTFDYTAIDSIPAGAQIAQAELSLSNFNTGACAGTATRISRVTGSWSLSTVNWANQPTVTADGSTTTTGSYGTTGCATETRVGFDATAIVNAWRGGADRRGVRLSADNESLNTGYRAFRSLENGDVTKVPKLTITYGSRPNTPTGLSVSPGYPGSATSLTPTLTANVTDPDSAQVRGDFEIRSGSTLVWSGHSAMATSGAQVTATVPAGVLSEGGTYTVKAYGNDGELQSAAATDPVTFKVDTIAPTVSITSTSYTNGSWRTGAPVSDTMTFHGSADTGAYYITLNGVEYTVGADSSGNWSNTWTPYDGWNTIDVAPLDRAGNRGATVSFNFGVGGPGINTPNDWAESPASFPVQASAPPGATGATLSWQLPGEATWRTATKVTNGASNWTGSVTSTSSRSYTPSLLWAATTEPLGSDLLHGPALILIKTCFTYTSAPTQCTTGRPVIITGSARGGNYPEAQVGPASVALATGDAQISGADAVDSKAGISRTFDSLDDATLTAGLFGPGWSDPAVLAAPDATSKANIVDNRTKDGTFVIIDPDSGSQAFKLKAGSTTVYLPVEPTGDATKLTYTAAAGGNPAKLELSRPLGSAAVTTTWTLKPSDTGGVSEWTVDDIDAPGTSSDVSVSPAPLSQRPVWIRESDPGAAATCTASTQTTGCRGLKITYTGTGSSTRVSKIDEVIGGTTVTTKTVATYTYDGAGKLSTVCSAAPSPTQPALCSSYTYTTASGRTLLAQMTEPGLKPWRFSYDSIGRLTTVKREKPTGGDATWSVDYNLTPASSGLPDLSASTAGQWGQKVIPTRVYAVYSPTNSTPAISDANLYYVPRQEHGRDFSV